MQKVNLLIYAEKTNGRFRIKQTRAQKLLFKSAIFNIYYLFIQFTIVRIYVPNTAGLLNSADFEIIS